MYIFLMSVYEFILHIVSAMHLERLVLYIVLLIQIGTALAEWLSSWLAEQEDWGSIPRLAIWIFRDWLSPASKSRYCWIDVNPQNNQPNNTDMYCKV